MREQILIPTSGIRIKEKTMDCMLDLETFNNTNDSVIIAIGAVKFDPKTKQITDKFYSRVDPQSCVNAGLTIGAGTVLWWLQQSDAARAEFKGELPPLKIVLEGFSAWMKRNPADLNHEHVWGNGATFDNVILTSAYNAMKMPRPWSYKGDRCYRTVKALYPEVPLPKRSELIAHRADHDAEFQAIHLMEIWPRLSNS